MITMQSQHISCLTTIIFFKVSQQRRFLREDVKKGKCNSLAYFYRSRSLTGENKMNMIQNWRHCWWHLNGEYMLIGQYLMDVIEPNSLGRTYVDLKISVRCFLLQGKRSCSQDAGWEREMIQYWFWKYSARVRGQVCQDQSYRLLLVFELCWLEVKLQRWSIRIRFRGFVLASTNLERCSKKIMSRKN